MAWAHLSDGELLALVGTLLKGAVAQELLASLGRRELIALVTAKLNCIAPAETRAISRGTPSYTEKGSRQVTEPVLFKSECLSNDNDQQLPACATTSQSESGSQMHEIGYACSARIDTQHVPHFHNTLYTNSGPIVTSPSLDHKVEVRDPHAVEMFASTSPTCSALDAPTEGVLQSGVCSMELATTDQTIETPVVQHTAGHTSATRPSHGQQRGQRQDIRGFFKVKASGREQIVEVLEHSQKTGEDDPSSCASEFTEMQQGQAVPMQQSSCDALPTQNADSPRCSSKSMPCKAIRSLLVRPKTGGSGIGPCQGTCRDVQIDLEETSGPYVNAGDGDRAGSTKAAETAGTKPVLWEDLQDLLFKGHQKPRQLERKEGDTLTSDVVQVCRKSDKLPTAPNHLSNIVHEVVISDTEMDSKLDSVETGSTPLQTHRENCTTSLEAAQRAVKRRRTCKSSSLQHGSTLNSSSILCQDPNQSCSVQSAPQESAPNDSSGSIGEVPHGLPLEANVEDQGCLVWNPAEDKPPAGTSLCTLRHGLFLKENGQRVRPSRGDMLLALVGAHPKWVLHGNVAACLRDALKPVQCEIKEDWHLRPHQADGYRWLMTRASTRLGGILADDMGLGKTRQAIAWLIGLREALTSSSAGGVADTGMHPAPCQTCLVCGGSGCGQPGCKPVTWERALVVAPAMLVRGEDSVWIKELRDMSKLWQTRLKVWHWYGEKATDLRSIAYTSEGKRSLVELFDIVVVGYEAFLNNQEQFCQERWTCVIIDEAQAIKNHSAQIAAAVKKLAEVPFRLAMTGSPIENSLDDVHSILQFVQPDCAGSLYDFRQRFPSTEEGQNMLRKFLQTLVLRRECEGSSIEMVAKEEVEVPVGMAPIQKQIYESPVKNVFVLKRFRDLELLCTHPWCYAAKATGDARNTIPERFFKEPEHQSLEDSGKLTELFKILRGLLARQEKVLIFFSRIITSELLAALIKREFGFQPPIVRGDMAFADREREIHEFQAVPTPGLPPPPQVLLLSVWVGSVGLNLPEARWVIHAERVWNPAREKQATSRAHRLTSKLSVKAYGLYTENSVEERKRTVLAHKCALSSTVMESLDGDLDFDEDADLNLDSSNSFLENLISGESAGTATNEDFETGSVMSDEEDADIGTDTCSDELRGLHPNVDKISPAHIIPPVIGKYGNPLDESLWDWYTCKGHREVHPNAHLASTAHMQENGVKMTSTPNLQFSSRPSRIHDAQARGDEEFAVDCGGIQCRLFIPHSSMHHFVKDEGGALRLAAPRPGMAPFPLFMPSSGRSAVHPQVGLLDLTATMVDADGKALDYVQIVAVKPSEVEMYRATAPFFVVFELPRTVVMTHPTYGDVTPEELGVGCSRHWLMKLADSLRAPYIFMLDDSVHCWRGVTLAHDPHPLFGLTAKRRAQFTSVPLGRVLLHLSDADFLQTEFARLSLIGFARFRPEMIRARAAYKRSHVYSALLVNVNKVLHQDKVNYLQGLFVWEDLQLNSAVRDICKCYRFAMIKRQYSSGGCTQYKAHSENPVVYCPSTKKLSPDQIAAEALQQDSGTSASSRSDGQGLPRGRKKGKHGKGQSSNPEVDDKDSTEPLAVQDWFKLEDEPELSVDGAVCDENGRLVTAYYKRFIRAFKDREQAIAAASDPAAPQRLLPSGMRRGETVPYAVRIWDDTRRRGVRIGFDWGNSWGAGWISEGREESAKARWWNIKTWGSWRLSFILARLQRAVWEKRCGTTGKHESGRSSQDGLTSAEAASGGAGCPSTPTGKRKKGKKQPKSTQKKVLELKGRGALMMRSRLRRKKAQGSSSKAAAAAEQPKLSAFFKVKPDPDPEPIAVAVQPTLRSFFQKPSKTQAE